MDAAHVASVVVVAVLGQIGLALAERHWLQMVVLPLCPLSSERYLEMGCRCIVVVADIADVVAHLFLVFLADQKDWLGVGVDDGQSLLYLLHQDLERLPMDCDLERGSVLVVVEVAVTLTGLHEDRSRR